MSNAERHFDVSKLISSLRWGSPENPMKSAYLVAQGYANFCKVVSIVIIHI